MYRKEHWQKLSQVDWPQQAATLRAENGLWQESNGGVTWRLDGSEGPLRMRYARLYHWYYPPNKVIEHGWSE